jgi:hypothetical protein
MIVQFYICLFIYYNDIFLVIHTIVPVSRATYIESFKTQKLKSLKLVISLTLPLHNLFRPVWPPSGGVNSVAGTAAPPYAVAIRVDAFFVHIIQF